MDCLTAIPDRMTGSIGAHQGRRAAPGPRLVLVILAVHVAAVAAACLLVGPRQTRQPPPEPALTLVFGLTAPPLDTPLQALASHVLEMPSEQGPATLAPTRRLTIPATRPTGMAQRRAAAPPAPFRQSPPPRPPAAAQTAASGTPDATATLHALAAWEARARQAVQDATIYPASARLLHRQGRARVQFTYDRGLVGSAAVVQSSHFAALDAAALAAVIRAALPAPPAELGPQMRTMLVWVQFTLVADD